MSVRVSGWSDEWTSALEGRSNSKGATPLPLAQADAKGGEAATAHAAGPEGLSGTDSIQLLQPHAHSSTKEQDEWAAVLDSKPTYDDEWPALGPELQQAARASVRLPAPRLESRLGAPPVATGSSAAIGTGLGPSPRLPTPQSGVGQPAIFVAIELGSHCTRAVLHDGVSELARLTYDTMLGQGTAEDPDSGRDDSGANGGFRPNGLHRTLEALRSIVSAAQAAASTPDDQAPLVRSSHEQGDGQCAPLDTAAGLLQSEASGCRVVARMVATAAVRGASEAARAALAEAARAVVGCSLEVLSGEEEGQLAWRGVVDGLPGQARTGAAATTGSACTTGGWDFPASGPVATAVAAAAAAQVASTQAPTARPFACAGPTANRDVAEPGGRGHHMVVVDMGGRSTEFIYGTFGSLMPEAVSVPLGCVGLYDSIMCSRAPSQTPQSATHQQRQGQARQLPDGQTSAAEGERAATGAELPCSRGAAEAGAGAWPDGGHGSEGHPRPDLDHVTACIALAEQTALEHCAGRPWLRLCRDGGTATAPDGQPPPPTSSPAAADPSPTHASDYGRTPAVVFTGGTVTTLAALHQALPYYDRARVHGSALTRQDIKDLMARLADPGGMAAALASYDWLTEARCRTLAAGCAGLLGVMAALRLERLVVSDADLLDGLLAELLEWERRREASTLTW